MKEMDKSRRNFLKVMFLGGGTLIAGKILSPLIGLLDGPSEKKGSEAFRAAEDDASMSIYDDSGAEVLQIDKAGLA